MSAHIVIKKDLDARIIAVSSQYHTSLENLWDAFTNPGMLEKWWAPKPYRAFTKKIHFANGGQWLYFMLSPAGEKQWCIAEFKNIHPKESFEVFDAFCDENGNINMDFPRMTWINNFREENGMATITNVITFATEEDMKKIIEMGFEEGYSIGLNQLQELLE